MPQKMDSELARCVLEGLMRYSNVILFVKNPDGQYLAVSDGWEQVTGISTQATLLKNDVEVFGTDVGGAFRHADVQVLEAGHPMVIEETLKKSDGDQFFISTKFPLRNSQGQLLGLCGVASDITPLRRMQSAINWIVSATVPRYGASLMQVFTQHIACVINADYCLIGRLQPDGQSMMTLAFVEQDTLLENTEISLRHSPTSQSKTADICLYEHGVQQEFPDYEILRLLGVEGYAGIPIFSSEGSRIGLLVALFKQPIREKDFVSDLFKLFTNRIASEMERLEREQAIIQLNAELEKRVEIRTRELQHALQELEMFNHCVSHDLKAPLRAIKGFADILMDDEQDRLSADGREMLTRVVNAARRMQGQIEALSKLVKLDTSPLVRKAVDISEMALRVGDVGKAVQAAQHATLKVQPGLVANSDPHLTELVLLHLLGNALKFSRHQPTPQVSLYQTQRNGKTFFVVEDNGVGFSMDYAAKLFSPFQRLHSKEEHEGHGIGLASVARIIQRHGGEIWAESEVNQGALFGFRFNGDDVH